MRFIGITGGVGAGKSTVLALLKENCNCKILLADEVAAHLLTPGHEAFDQVVALPWEKGVLGQDGLIDRPLMASQLYGRDDLREQVNAIVHPAVQKEVLHQVEEAANAHQIEWFFFEAALLIECGYDKLCDELWYIFATEDVRRERLKANRGYSDERIDAMMASQLSDEVYRRFCKEIIDNSFDMAATKQQIVKLLNV